MLNPWKVPSYTDSIYGDRVRPQKPAAPELPVVSEDAERSTLASLGNMALTSLGYVGSMLDKTFGGRAVRGLLGGKPRELLSIIPGSDTVGLTNFDDAVYGRDLLEKAGIAGHNEEGLDAGDVGGFLSEVFLDPATYMTGGITAAGKALARAGWKAPSRLAAMKGVGALESQVKRLPPVAAGHVSVADATRGLTVLPEAAEQAAREAGVEITPQFTREMRQAGVGRGKRMPWAGRDLPPGMPASPDLEYRMLGPDTVHGVENVGKKRPRVTRHDLVNTPTEAATPLRGAIGFDLPFGLNKLFGTEGVQFGFGPLAQKYAGALDAAGDWAGKTKIGTLLKANFSAPYHGAIDPRVQEVARDVYDPALRRGEVEARRTMGGVLHGIEPVVGREPGEVAYLMRRRALGLPDFPDMAAYEADLKVREPAKYQQLTTPGNRYTIKDLADIVERRVPAYGAADEMWRAGAATAEAERPLGLPVAEVGGDLDYFHRRKADLPWEEEAVGRGRPPLGGASHPAQKARQKMFALMPGGEAQIDALAKLHVLDEAGNVLPALVGPEEGRLLNNLESQAFARTELLRDQGRIITDPRAIDTFAPANFNRQEILDAARGLKEARAAGDAGKDAAVEAAAQMKALVARREEVNAAARKWQDYLGTRDPRHVTEGIGIFDADLPGALEERLRFSGQAKAAAEASTEVLRRLAEPRGSYGEPVVSLGDAVRKLGLTGRTESGRPVINNLLYNSVPGVETRGAWKKLEVPESAVNDLTRWRGNARLPDEQRALLGFLDPMLKTFRGYTTLPWIGHHVRNLFSGLFDSWRDDALGLGARADAKILNRGGVLPAERAALYGAAGRPLEAADQLLGLAHEQGVAFRHGTTQAADLAGVPPDAMRINTQSYPGRVRLDAETLAERLKQHAVPAGTPGTSVQDIVERMGLNTAAPRSALEQAMGRPIADMVVPNEALSEALSSTLGERVSGWASGKNLPPAAPRKPLPPDAGRWARAKDSLGSAKEAVDRNVLGRSAGVSEAVESDLRLGHFLEKLRQGFTPEAAAADVLKYQRDYSRLAPFERDVMRRLVPFYNFSRQNLPVILSDLAQKPAKLAASIRASTGGLSGEEDFIPPYLREGTAVPIPGAPEGSARYLSSFGLPYEDEFVKSLGAFMAGDWRRGFGNLAGQLRPEIKLPIESATGVQLSSGRKLDDLRVGPTAGALSFGSEDYGRPISQVIANTPLSRVTSTIDRLADDRKGIAEKVLNLGTGVRVTDVDLARQKEIAAREILGGILKDRPGVESFERLYVKPENVPNLSSQEFALYQLYRQLEKQAQAAARARKTAEGPPPGLTAR